MYRAVVDGFVCPNRRWVLTRSWPESSNTPFAKVFLAEWVPRREASSPSSRASAFRRKCAWHRVIGRLEPFLDANTYAPAAGSAESVERNCAIAVRARFPRATRREAIERAWPPRPPLRKRREIVTSRATCPSGAVSCPKVSVRSSDERKPVVTPKSRYKRSR